MMAAITFLCLFATAASAAPSFVDDSGRTVVVEKPFERIVSLYGAHTENLFSLGLDEQVIGVPRSTEYPPAAAEKPRFSYRDDPERFLAANPDLVLIRPMIYRGYRNLVDRLEQFGIRVASLQPNGVEEMFRYWRRLGMLTGREERADSMIAGFKASLEELKARVADVPREDRPRVYFESIHRRMKTFAPDSTAIFVLETAGGVNVASDAKAVRGTNIAEYGKERILSHASEIDVYLAQRGAMNDVTVETIVSESGFRAIKAVREGRVYIVDERIVSRPTVRLLEGVETVQAYLYPDRLGK
jgi:iron complex transport system substrate-binding protein